MHATGHQPEPLQSRPHIHILFPLPYHARLGIPNGLLPSHLANKLHVRPAMAQAFSRGPLTSEARVRTRDSPCGNCGRRSSTGTGLSPNSSHFPCQYHSNMACLTHIPPGEWTIGPLKAAVQRSCVIPSIWTTTTTNVVQCIISLMRTTCPSHPIFFDLITVIIIGQENRILSFILNSFYPFSFYLFSILI
jgi:hypothetical protein